MVQLTVEKNYVKSLFLKHGVNQEKISTMHAIQQQNASIFIIFFFNTFILTYYFCTVSQKLDENLITIEYFKKMFLIKYDK